MAYNEENLGVIENILNIDTQRFEERRQEFLKFREAYGTPEFIAFRHLIDHVCADNLDPLKNIFIEKSPFDLWEYFSQKELEIDLTSEFSELGYVDLQARNIYRFKGDPKIIYMRGRNIQIDSFNGVWAMHMELNESALIGAKSIAKDLADVDFILKQRITNRPKSIIAFPRINMENLLLENEKLKTIFTPLFERSKGGGLVFDVNFEELTKLFIRE